MKTITTLFLVLLFNTANSQITAEVNIGSKRMDIVLNMLHHLDAKSRWSIYSRNLAGIHHSSNGISLLTFNKLSYTLKSGIGVSANLVGNFSKFYPSIGVHLDKELNRVSLYFLTTYAFNPIIFNESIFIATYDHPVNSVLNLFLQGEFYASFHRWSHNLFVNRIKLGMEVHKTRIGLFYEFVQNGGKVDRKTINFGASIKQTF